MKVAENVPVLPLRDLVVYPQGVHSLLVGTASSIRAIAALGTGQELLLVAKREAEVKSPQAADLFAEGTLAAVLQSLKLQDGTLKILVEGRARAKIERLDFSGAHIVADVATMDDAHLAPADAQALMSTALAQFKNYAQASRKVPQETLSSLEAIAEPSHLLDAIAAQLELPLAEKQALLATLDLGERGERLLSLIAGQEKLSQMERKIRGRVSKQMEQSQREYYLNEQMKAIQKELGTIQESSSEFDLLKAAIDQAGLPREAKDKALGELAKLKQMQPMSAEATVVRAYLDWMVQVPWKKRSRIGRDLHRAQRILEEDHHGLEEVKERILEYLAVQARVGRVKGPVLCLVGPPGVGKTSLGESIARATGRRFVRMALGGVRDEAEIRGHRRTYIGAMPGKVLQRMAKVGVRNPLFLLDEVDKMGMDYRGDPASALLEVLDPEQNSRFGDHYLEIDYDLSDVFFVCTSNSMNIPPPLLDRMEVIRLPGYTEDEKLNIAKRFLLPKQMSLAGLKDDELHVAEEALMQLIRHYTREAGVRGLEREVAKLVRKVVKRKAMDGGAAKVRVDAADVEGYNGVLKFTFGLAEEKNRVGVATGLAWTEAGGELLNIEAVAVPGKGRQTKTGSLGDVMQESIQAAMTFVRSRGEVLGAPKDFHEKYDLHVHVPEGATPKDGPSAGIGMCTALVSVVTGIPVRADVAMTGEITLHGQLLRIGGLKEKLLAAHRGGVRQVIIPAENERDLKEIAESVKDGLSIRPAKWMDEVLELALERRPAPAMPRLPAAALAEVHQPPGGQPASPH